MGAGFNGSGIIWMWVAEVLRVVRKIICPIAAQERKVCIEEAIQLRIEALEGFDICHEPR